MSVVMHCATDAASYSLSLVASALPFASNIFPFPEDRRPSSFVESLAA